MASYMTGGRQRVRWNGATSSFLDRLHGVAQGSKAGPLLFIFVTMVNFALLKSAVGYADDTSNSNALVAGLNSDSEVLVGLSKELGLVLNPSKTQCVIYGSVPDSAEPVTVDGVTIAPSDRISILGFTLDRELQTGVYLKELADKYSLPEACGRKALSPSASTRSKDVCQSHRPWQNEDVPPLVLESAPNRERSPH